MAVLIISYVTLRCFILYEYVVTVLNLMPDKEDVLMSHKFKQSNEMNGMKVEMG